MPFTLKITLGVQWLLNGWWRFFVMMFMVIELIQVEKIQSCQTTVVPQLATAAQSIVFICPTLR